MVRFRRRQRERDQGLVFPLCDLVRLGGICLYLFQTAEREVFSRQLETSAFVVAQTVGTTSQAILF
jgi:hypothetical protein